MTASADAADRLMTLNAAHKLSPAAADELFRVLDAARDRFNRLKAAEDPKSNLVAGAGFGWDLHDFATKGTSSGRRGEVLAAVKEWWPDVVAVSDEHYRLTVGGWAKRAKAARVDSADAYKPRTRV